MMYYTLQGLYHDKVNEENDIEEQIKEILKMDNVIAHGSGVYRISCTANIKAKAIFDYMSQDSNPNNRLYAVLKSKEKNYMVFEDVDTNEPILVHNNFDLKKRILNPFFIFRNDI